MMAGVLYADSDFSNELVIEISQGELLKYPFGNYILEDSVRIIQYPLYAIHVPSYIGKDKIIIERQSIIGDSKYTSNKYCLEIHISE